MTWIKTPPPSSDPKLRDALLSQRDLYPAEYGKKPEPGRLHPLVENDSIVMSHALIPGALQHAFSEFGALMASDLPLSRRDHEMIAATVSAINDCFY